MQMPSTRHLLPLPLLLTALSVGWLGCTGRDTLQIGVVVPLTGEYQSYGESNKRGIEIALEEINSNGYPLVLEPTVEDSGSDPAKASELLEQRFKEGAFVALGGTVSSEAKAMVAVADKYDRVLLSPSATSPGLTKISTNFYRIAPSDLTEGNKMADFAFRSLEVRRAVILAQGEEDTQGVQQAFRSAFEKHGGEIVETIVAPPNTSDLGGLIGRVITLAPDAVYLAAYESGIAAMISELRQQNFEGRILTTHSFASPAAIARVGDAAVGVILTQSVFEPDSEHAHVQKFVSAYRERYGEEPDLFAAEGYDAMRVLAMALETRNALPSEVPRGLRDEIKEFPGVTGSIQFDEGGDVRKFPRVYGVGQDLALYDYSKRIEQDRKELLAKQAELQARLAKLREDAAKMATGS